MPLTAPTYPSGMTNADLMFSTLVDTFIADEVFYGMGSYTAEEVGTKFATKSAMATELSTYCKQIGELAEKPGKTDSKINKLKTRNYQIPGKRTSTVELTLNGISAKQKDYFEGTLFSGAEVTIICVSKERDRATIFNGMRWTVDWSGEADGLWTVVISTEFSGTTNGKVFLIKGLT
ncbi:MAG: hypothetical protein BWY95_00242 [Bacteroidetes bacterium ADurb.BinA104]|nr:MAG: hypothetical protein BWY95_00242 [Bacteroidetes bacterium ADurb.BinA104]